MKLTNIHNVPQSLVNAVTNDRYDGPKGELKRISATGIIDSPRIHFLKSRHWAELTEDVSGRLWALLGTAVHAILERAEDSKSIKEERVNEEINGLVISGQMDILQEHKIEDWKTTSVWSVVFNPNGKPEWEKQLNIYAWLAHKRGFEIKELVINAILRDHQGSKAKADPTYPQIPFVSIPVNVWPIEQTESYLNGRVELFKSCAGLDDDKLPVCTSDEMWEKAGTWAVMKPGRKRAVAVCETELEAKNKCAPGCSIVERPAFRTRCESYCQVAAYCNIYKAYKGAA